MKIKNGLSLDSLKAVSDFTLKEYGALPTELIFSPRIHAGLMEKMRELIGDYGTFKNNASGEGCRYLGMKLSPFTWIPDNYMLACYDKDNIIPILLLEDDEDAP